MSSTGTEPTIDEQQVLHTDTVDPIDALDLTADRRREPGVRAVTPYSFGTSAHLTTEKAALYTDAARQVASDMAARLSEWLLGFTVEVGPLLEIMPGEDAHDRIEDFDASLILAKSQSSGTVLTEQSLALALVTGLMGGAAMSAGDPRALTSIEKRVLDLVTNDFVQVAASTLLIDFPLEIDRKRMEAFAASNDDQPEARVGFSFRIHGPGGGGEIVLAFDLWVLQTFSDVIDTRLSGRRRSLTTTSDPATQAALTSVPLPFTVGLGRISLTAQQVVELREGDVVRTGQPVDSDMIAAVDGVELFFVRLGQSNHRLTAEVLAPIAQSTSRTPARMGLS